MTEKRIYGLIGHPLGHSFSQQYFQKKFKQENITDAEYRLFDIADIDDLDKVIKENKRLKGFNVTIPHKQNVIEFLDHLDESARKVGAVNVVKITKDGSTGYNSDFYGFKTSLLNWTGHKNYKALILGTGGASKAVQAVLNDMNIPFTLVSRNKKENTITYSMLNDLSEWLLIINTTPLGMEPNTNVSPDIPYETLENKHYLYDLVYNPEETLFMKKGKAWGARVKNGLEMLNRQAEKSWEIWNS